MSRKKPPAQCGGFFCALITPNTDIHRWWRRYKAGE
nr:MAG TPA: Trp-operon Leader Peptide [Caudoviricetes sp.]